MTAQDVQAIEIRRESLSDQLQSAEGRRDRLIEELRTANSSAERTGLERRIELLDDRILQLERDIAETGQQLTSAEAGLAAVALETEQEEPTLLGGLSSDQVTAISIVFIVTVLLPLAIAFSRYLWKRARAPLSAVPPIVSQRLERLEHAVDAVAIEMERVSEGTRYLTRLLGESRGHAGDREPEPVRIADPHAVRGPRGSG